MKIETILQLQRFKGSELEQGEVYQDPFGHKVMASDEGSVINLSDGVVFVIKRDYDDCDDSLFLHYPDAKLVLM